MSNTSPSNTSPPSAGDRSTTLHNLVVVVDARRRAVLLAWLLDTIVMWAAVAALIAAVPSLAPDTASAVVLAVMTMPVACVLYGFTTAHRRSLGQLAAGTRTVRAVDGTVPGFWRAGWVMLVRLVFFPLFFAFLVMAMLDGGVDVDGKVRHLSIDDRATKALWRAQPRLAQPWLDWPGTLA